MISGRKGHSDSAKFLGLPEAFMLFTYWAKGNLLNLGKLHLLSCVLESVPVGRKSQLLQNVGVKRCAAYLIG